LRTRRAIVGLPRCVSRSGASITPTGRTITKQKFFPGPPQPHGVSASSSPISRYCSRRVAASSMEGADAVDDLRQLGPGLSRPVTSSTRFVGWQPRRRGQFDARSAAIRGRAMRAAPRRRVRPRSGQLAGERGACPHLPPPPRHRDRPSYRDPPRRDAAGDRLRLALTSKGDTTAEVHASQLLADQRWPAGAGHRQRRRAGAPPPAGASSNTSPTRASNASSSPSTTTEHTIHCAPPIPRTRPASTPAPIPCSSSRRAGVKRASAFCSSESTTTRYAEVSRT
jgi:hypothetical protein